jgi:DnaK suppressor protein
VAKKASSGRPAGKAGSKPDRGGSAGVSAGGRQRRSAPRPGTGKAGAVAAGTGRGSATRRPSSKPASASKSGSGSRGSEAEHVVADAPLPKSKLTAKQLQTFKEILLAKRRELLGDVHNLAQDALGRSRQDASGDLSNMPIHMADLGSDNWEQEFTLGLVANEQQLVRDIDDSLQRIEEGTYGICLATHKPITLARLRAKPWAKHCIEYARKRELGRA